jgi:YbbR domain-containing protein
MLTIMFWLTNKLAQEYSTTLKISPKLKSSLAGVYSDATDNTLYVQVRASGFFIIGKKFSESNSINIDIKGMFEEQQRTSLKIATVNLRDQIRDNFDKSMQILSIEPDTIYYNIFEHVTKKVPVKDNFTLSFKEDFRQCAPIQLSPDSVTIAGLREHVDEMTAVYISPEKYEGVDETVEDISTVVTKPGIFASPSKIRYKIPVERCTEGTASVAVKTVNMPENSKLMLLPAKVSIKYAVPLKDYESVSENDFLVEVDFEETKTSLNRHLKAKVVRQPSSVFDVKVEPAFVEFLIQK